MFQMKMIFFAVPVRRNSEENCETGTKNNCDLFLPMYPSILLSLQNSGFFNLVFLHTIVSLRDS